MLVDSHCHLDFPDLAADEDAVLARGRAAGVGFFLSISTHVSRFETYAALARRHADVAITVGTHPHNAAAEPDVPVSRLVELSTHPKCVGIGEAGLDYFYDKSPRDVQERIFRRHIAAARETGLPLVIHSRDADADMAAILREEMGKGAFGAVLHCFTGSGGLAETAVSLGLMIGFTGIITFRKSDELRDIARNVPLDRLLVETDAPYLAPEPFRGKRNEPAHVVHTARRLAEVKGISAEELAAVTTANFFRLFAKADGQFAAMRQERADA
jgi:TatD DNase family protein